MPTMPTTSEVDLYEPLASFLEKQGYTVHAEVNGLDIVARRGEELVAVELKRQFGVRLLAQAADRQRVVDSVYVALPAPEHIGRNGQWRKNRHLLKRLELGLIWVHFRKSGTKVEIAFHPQPYTGRRSPKRRRSLIREMDGRSGNYNRGGSATGRPVITAYREKAVFIACCLSERGPSSPRALRDMGTGDKTQSILARNVYGWFERIDRGVYALHESGRMALERYPELADYYRQEARRTYDPSLAR